MSQQTMPDRRADTPAITHVGFILEVAADSLRDLGDKLYGYDDLEAERVAMGYDPHNYDVDHEYIQTACWDERASREDIEAVQAEQDTVNDLLEDAVFAGHPVLCKTDGTNLASVTAESDDVTEIPHFCHGASDCDDVDACHAHPDAGGVYRMFPEADLILAGTADASLSGSYQLCDDVVVTITRVQSDFDPGTTDATRIDGAQFDLSDG